MGDLPLFGFTLSLFGVALDDVRLWGFERKSPPLLIAAFVVSRQWKVPS